MPVERIFELSGKIVDADGKPAHEVVVAIVDKDPLLDDLLGIGAIGEQGTFCLSFTTASFRQEWLEREKTPDIVLIFSVIDDDVLIPIHRIEFAELRFEDGREELGEISLPWRVGDSPTRLDGVDPLPGYRKSARRMGLDDGIVSHAVEVIVPVVESLTGWKNLLDRTKVQIVAKPGDAMSAVMEQMHGKALSRRQRLAVNVVYGIGGLMALYDPFGGTVHVVRSVAETQNLDGLKVTIGHELVHAGQFLNHPELVEHYRTWAESLQEADSRDNTTEEYEAAESESLIDPRLGAHAEQAYQAGFGAMANIEGYASYIENDFIRKIYNCGTLLPHRSLWQKMLVRLDTWAKGGEENEPSAGIMTSKAAEYDVGHMAYRRLQIGDRPARFDPALRPEPPEDDHHLPSHQPTSTMTTPTTTQVKSPNRQT